MSTQQLSPKSSGGTFSDRIRLLIQRVGSATEIARMCGFSEGVVRSWRDGNTDPSRARCVTLARTLGISLVWLVAGEGAIQADPSTKPADEQYSSEVVRSQRPRAKLDSVKLRPVTQLRVAAHANGLDPQRLNTAMQMLQSELELTDSPMTLAENTDLLTELYEILAPGGVHVDSSAMMAFNRHLAERVRKSRLNA
ncbi:MAG TPA: helix-turn-helix transcriptional regulator [Rhodanobacter sp.]|nr:helix-turn-helix transcriptional regulator [Rhodanobacter sp.]